MRKLIWAGILAYAVLGNAAPTPVAASNTSAAKSFEIRVSRALLEDRIYASWLGQMAGNIYGLPHENVHIDEPGPENFPYGYDALEISYYQYHFASTRMTGVMRAFGGAFSDDDTDIEYVYLRLMEEAGIEPGYEALRRAWIDHVDNWVWLANRQSLALMHEGYDPPYTGREGINADWFQIDPQLVNEIWAITAPGMVDYAAAKSAWAGRVMADGNGLGPTIAYGAMFAAAITEPDVQKLVDIGAAALPESAEFRRVIAEMKALHARYPEDWKAARAAMAEKYYRQQPRHSIWDANLNGACAILALLYGEGDFQRTLDLASAMGFDADNQAATLGGLLGMAHGTAGIPRAFLYPVESWTEPFNDRFLNRSRRDMPSGSIRDIARRTALQAEKVVLANGGRIEQGQGGPVLVIPTSAHFTPPLEIAAAPQQTLEIGKPWRWPLYGGGSAPSWRVASGALPPGLSFGADGSLTGTPDRTGRFTATIEASERKRAVRRDLSWLVVGRNLAPAATEIFASDPALAGKLELLRDGRSEDGEDVVTTPGPVRLERFGYRWSTPVNVGAIIVMMGHMEEASGWLTSLGAEYQTVDGQWHGISGITPTPELALDNDKHLHPHYGRYTFSFRPLQAKAIRITGLSGGEGDKRTVRLSELAVYGP